MKIPSINHPKLVYYRRYKSNCLVPEYIIIVGKKVISSIDPEKWSCVDGGVILHNPEDMIMTITHLNDYQETMVKGYTHLSTSLFNGDNFNKAYNLLKRIS